MTLSQFDRLPDLERSLRVAEWHAEAARCGNCGFERSMCSDPERHWFPQRVVDYAVAEQMAAARMYDLLHEEKPFHNGDFRSWSAKADPFHPYRYDDGVTIFVTPVDHGLGGDFLSPPAAPDMPTGGDSGHASGEGSPRA